MYLKWIQIVNYAIKTRLRITSSNSEMSPPGCRS